MREDPRDAVVQIERSFRTRGFVCPREVSTALVLADALDKPVLLEGPPGVGKTEIAKLWAAHHGIELIRMQCYEGLDEAKALYEWSYGKQMLYAQLLRDTVGELLAGAGGVGEAMRRLHGQTDRFFSRDFLLPRPLLRAVLSDAPVVLLVDEVDRSDEEFEAFLLELLSDRQVTVPELGTISARHAMRAILTSNDTRELSDALRRRCLYVHIDYPTPDDERAILRERVPGLDEAVAERIVRFVASLRRADLRKTPGTAEVIDWATALLAVGADGLSTADIRRTLGVLLKNRDDIDRVSADIARHRS